MQDSKRDTDVKYRFLDSVGEGEGVMVPENSIETCILSYVNRSPVQVPYMRQGAPRPVHWDDPEGWERGS